MVRKYFYLIFKASANRIFGFMQETTSCHLMCVLGCFWHPTCHRIWQHQNNIIANK